MVIAQSNKELWVPQLALETFYSNSGAISLFFTISLENVEIHCINLKYK